MVWSWIGSLFSVHFVFVERSVAVRCYALHLICLFFALPASVNVLINYLIGIFNVDDLLSLLPFHNFFSVSTGSSLNHHHNNWLYDFSTVKHQSWRIKGLMLRLIYNAYKINFIIWFRKRNDFFCSVRSPPLLVGFALRRFSSDILQLAMINIQSFVAIARIHLDRRRTETHLRNLQCVVCFPPWHCFSDCCTFGNLSGVSVDSINTKAGAQPN